MIHAHAIKQMDKELIFQNLHCIGICSAVLIGESLKERKKKTTKKNRSYTPYNLSTEHTESTMSKILTTVYFFFDKQARKTNF